MKRLVLAITAAIALSGSALGQTEQVRTISGGVLNGKAVSLPKPEYAIDAKEAKAQGAVAVDVEIDENGTVVSAVSRPYDQAAKKNEDGSLAEVRELHPALRQSAETAALAARFSPTLLSGAPVRVKGTIMYNFVAGEPVETKNAGISGGVLNGKALSLPAPEYPAAALAVRASGAVSVQVLVDEEGNVVSASAVSGHPLLRAAAVAAAREAKFGPVMLSGKPVKVSGVVTYNFTPGEK
jgi:TonB family protein